ncbi:SDR family NAD(P)-dependent oxidoreductase [Variovorax sp. J2P1-59]|uniref:SDR family NAD(P)-dependent oxidoreductase n=1 Tax=Variovorax flavidus TaxID=3053501 RepID=UPI002574EC1B|nr:SDR family NAD(P)-dependent oxidoreductase [Variovorax sp. J2P1-59]MDM0074796.1 SDR family NAD(P)-dependent oxidoreductase [Variovorax sp. J2P1-59]
MTRILGATSTADDVLSGTDLRGKRVLVTGVSSGLGVETARSLAAHGAQVVGTARDLPKAAAATGPVRADAAHGGSLELVALDLASLVSVRACADALVHDGRPFDLVIANAGVMATPPGRTLDGFETQLGTNHLGHFVLVNRIEPLIADGGRVVVVASASHRSADFSLDDLNFERTAYEPRTAYARSKTANILFAVEFDRRHAARGVRATAVHPGTIRTELGRHIGNEAMDQAIRHISADLVARGEPPFEWKTVPQGAATTVWAGVVASAAEVGGRYCENCHVSEVIDRPVSPLAEGVRSYALDPEIAGLLWRRSEELVGEHF